MTDNEHGFFWVAFTLGAMVGIGAVALLMIFGGGGGTPTPDLGEGCDMKEDGSALCYDPETDSGWYFDEGTFTQ